MAKKQKKQKQKKVIKHKPKNKKIVKKKFFEVAVPLTSTKIHLYAGTAEELNNKVVKLDLTKNLRGKSLEIKFRIKADGETLTGTPESLSLAISYIRRVMRKGVDYCEDSFEAETRDAVVRIKPFLITRKRVSRAVLKGLREEANKFLLGYLKTRDAQEIIQEIMTNKLQKQMSLKLKKVYPLALCEIRVFKILKQKETSEEK